MAELLCLALLMLFAAAITKYTIVFLTFMALLFKFTVMDRWWLWFVVILVLLVKAGYQPGMIALAVILVFFKVLRDIFTTSRAN
jgi:hypothetical protein